MLLQAPARYRLLLDLANTNLGARRAPCRNVHHGSGSLRRRRGEEIEKLAQTVKSTGAVLPSIALGSNYEPRSSRGSGSPCSSLGAQAAERRAQRHRTSSRLTVTYGFDGVRAALDPRGGAVRSEQGRELIVG